MATALIAEDEGRLAQVLRDELRALWPELEVVAIASDGDAASRLLAECGVDVAFLDISMPGRSGLDVARDAAALETPPQIVFVTAHDEHALAAFDAAAVDYVLKPIRRERLAAAVDKVRARLGASSPAMAAVARAAVAAALAQLGLRGTPATPGAAHGSPLRFVRASIGHGEQQTVRLIPIDEVVYFEAADKYVRVLTRDGEALIRTPLRELLDQLDTQRFWQVHRGTVVNIDEVVAAEPGSFGKLRLRLKSRKERVDVSRAWAHLFKQM